MSGEEHRKPTAEGLEQMKALHVREKGALPLEVAIATITSRATAKLGIENRGQIAEGMWADIVIFDPDRIIDKATFDDSKQFPERIDSVLVNGVKVIEKRSHRCDAGSRRLRPGPKDWVELTGIPL